MKKVTAIGSQKGGTGKSTTAIALSAGLVRRSNGRKKVLLIDVDSQANSSKVLLPNYQQLRKEDTVHRTILGEESLPIHQTAIPGLSIVPAHILLSNADVEITRDIDEERTDQRGAASRLKRQLDQVINLYDYVIIDCPPSLGWLTLNAFTAADQVIVIVSPGYFELDSIVQISKTITLTQQYFNEGLQLRGYLFTMSDPTVTTANSIAIMRKMYSDQFLKTIIPRNTDLRDAHFAKQDIFAYNPSAKGAVAYARLVEELYPV